MKNIRHVIYHRKGFIKSNAFFLNKKKRSHSENELRFFKQSTEDYSAIALISTVIEATTSECS